MAEKNPEEDRVILNVEDVRVDANPDTIVSMISALIHIPSYRKSFEADPVAHLEECGITVRENLVDKITPESIRATLDELTEGSEEQTVAAIPGVGVLVRVGTRPGTSPGVRVGVQVATQTSTFAEPAEPSARGQGTGLAARQKEQEVKRQRRAKTTEGTEGEEGTEGQ